MSRSTVIKAEAEVAAGLEPSDRLRVPGGGDKPLIPQAARFVEALDALVQPETRGSPTSLLRSTSKSSTKIADDLTGRGFARTVLLDQLGYSLQANAKVTEGRQHPRSRRPVPLSRTTWPPASLIVINRRLVWAPRRRS